MTFYVDTVQRLNRLYNDKIRKVAAPLLKYFNVTNFWYYKMTNDGLFSVLGSHSDWMDYFAGNEFYIKYPFHRHPTLVQEGVFLHTESPYQPLQAILDVAKNKFNIHMSLQLVNKIKDGFEEFGFCANNSSDAQISLFINQLPLLRLFIKKFREDNRRLLSHIEDNPVNMARIVGSKFYEPNPLMTFFTEKRQALLKDLGIDISTSLSSRELETIKWILKGYSANQIAKQLFLSKRTIEHRVEKIKEKLSCDTRVDLVEKGRALELLGYFL